MPSMMPSKVLQKLPGIFAQITHRMELINSLDEMWEQRTRREISDRCFLETQRSQNLSSPLDIEECQWQPIHQKRSHENKSPEITSNVQRLVCLSWQLQDSLLDFRSASLGHGDVERLQFYEEAMRDHVRGKRVLVIGSGTGGLLGILASRQGASLVTCFESSAVGLEVSKTVLDNNNAYSVNLSLDPVVKAAEIVIVDLSSHREMSSALVALGNTLEHLESSNVVVIPSHVDLNAQLLCIDPRKTNHLNVMISEAVKGMRWSTTSELVDLDQILSSGSGMALSDPQTLHDLSIIEAVKLASISKTSMGMMVEMPLTAAEGILTHVASWTSLRFEPSGGPRTILLTQSKASLHHLDLMNFSGSGSQALILSEVHGCSSKQLILAGIKLRGESSIKVNINLGRPRFSSLPKWMWNELEQGIKFKAYASAINNSIKAVQVKGSISLPHILHIGAQSSCGSLACHSALSGARVTCHSSNPLACDLISRVIALNCSREVPVEIVKSLNVLSSSPADIAVLECLDVGLLGESCLHRLSLAREAGAISDATIIIPSKATLWSALASVTVKPGRNKDVDLSSLGLFDRCMDHGQDYSAIDLSSDPRSIVLLSEPERVIDVDFTASKEELLKSREQSFVLKCNQEGEVNAMISWFSCSAHADDRLLFETGPGKAMDAALYWLPSKLVQVDELVGAIAIQHSDGITFSIDAGKSDSPLLAHSSLLERMKNAHKDLISVLSRSNAALAPESKGIAMLARDLSAFSPSAASFLQRLTWAVRN
jgi:predicted RNA methylase